MDDWIIGACVPLCLSGTLTPYAEKTEYAEATYGHEDNGERVFEWVRSLVRARSMTYTSQRAI